MKWEPKDIVALVVVAGAVSLLWQGIDNIVGFSLLGIIVGYYGIDLTPFIKVGRNQGKKKPRADIPKEK